MTTHWADVDPDDIAWLYGDCEPAWEPRRRDVHHLPDISTYQEAHMICPPCAQAADHQAPRDQHCDDPKCMCGHRTDRYGTTTSHRPVDTGGGEPG